MKRKTAVIVVAYFSAALAFLGLYAALRRSGEEVALRSSRYAGEYAFEELCSACDGLSTALEKASLATSPGLEATLCSDAYACSLSALTALGQLPFSTVEMTNTSAFLGRSGDYARCLMRTASSGGALSEEERRDLSAISRSAAWLSEGLRSLRGEITEGTLVAGDSQEALLAIEAEFPEQSALRYDGCYTQEEPDCALLRGKGLCSEHEAGLIAADFLDLRPQNAASAGKLEGTLPCWRVVLGDSVVQVTEQGGQVLQCASSRPIGEPRLSAEEAAEAGDKFLREHGYPNMKLTLSSVEDRCFTGSWCCVDGDVLCYTDEIRLTLAMDDGSVVCFDAEEYVKHHGVRELDTHTYAWEDARSALSPELTVEEEYLSLISTPGGGEKLCLSFRCSREDGEQCIVFCSASTGAQERIALLRQDGQGTRSV